MPSERQPATVTREAIVASACALVKENGVENLSVSSIMAHARISRTAFYRQFNDRNAVMAEILEQATAELIVGAGPWLTDPNTIGSPETIKAALLSFANAFHANGPLLSALAEASRVDEQLHKMWRHGLVGEFDVAVAAAIARDQGAGHIRPGLDPAKTALGLNLMVEAVAVEVLGRLGAGTPDDFVSIVAPIWIYTLFEHDM